MPSHDRRDRSTKEVDNYKDEILKRLHEQS